MMIFKKSALSTLYNVYYKLFIIIQILFFSILQIIHNDKTIKNNNIENQLTIYYIF